MITIRFNCHIPKEIIPYINQYNSVYRIAYNRFKENLTANQIINLFVKEQKYKNINLLDRSIIAMSVNKAKSLIKKDKVIFGGNYNFIRRKKNSITSDEWNELRNNSMLLRGSSFDKNGNRKACLDIENNQIIFKPKRGIRYEIKLPTLSKQQKLNLLLLQHLCEQHETCFSLEITRNSISIIYDEQILKSNYKQVIPIDDRILSLDLNPNYIGLVIYQKNKLIHKEIIDLKDINSKKYNTNKRKYEILQISNYIINKTIHYRANIAFELLNIEPKDNKIGRNFNRLVNNCWNRNLLINNLKKWCNIQQIKYYEIYCAYSSFIGQMENPNEYDSIAAAIEINKRAQLAQKHMRYEILPVDINLSLLSNRWKKEIIDNGINTWLEFHNHIKKSKSSYRVLFTRNSNSLSLFSNKADVYYVNLFQNR